MSLPAVDHEHVGDSGTVVCLQKRRTFEAFDYIVLSTQPLRRQPGGLHREVIAFRDVRRAVRCGPVVCNR